LQAVTKQAERLVKGKLLQKKAKITKLYKVVQSGLCIRIRIGFEIKDFVDSDSESGSKGKKMA
jgi:hypothetical protein